MKLDRQVHRLHASLASRTQQFLSRVLRVTQAPIKGRQGDHEEVQKGGEEAETSGSPGVSNSGSDTILTFNASGSYTS